MLIPESAATPHLRAPTQQVGQLTLLAHVDDVLVAMPAVATHQRHALPPRACRPARRAAGPEETWAFSDMTAPFRGLVERCSCVFDGGIRGGVRGAMKGSPGLQVGGKKPVSVELLRPLTSAAGADAAVELGGRAGVDQAQPLRPVAPVAAMVFGTRHIAMTDHAERGPAL